jgi:SNF2 family DNA or RNA helicase
MVLDEAHTIRNHLNETAIACCKVIASRRWAMTGTPIQNSLLDLGSLLKFLRAYPFDDPAVFKKTIAGPFAREDPTVFASLRILLGCLALRRTKEKIPGLPPKEEMTLPIEMSGNERKCYEILVRNMADLMAKKQRIGASFGSHFLTGITRMRRFCAHKQELMTIADLKMFQGLAADNPVELLDDDDEADGEEESGPELLTRQVALDMVRLTLDSNCDTCGGCGKKLALDVAGDDEDGAVYGHMLQCYHTLCHGCLDWWDKSSTRHKDRPKYVRCSLCSEDHRIERVKLDCKEVATFLENQRLLQGNARVSRQLGPYIGPSTKVQYLIEQLENFRVCDKEHPDKLAKA